MFEQIVLNEATAAKRRIHFSLVSDDGLTFEDLTITGVKMPLTFADGTEANSTNDLVKESVGKYYIELTQAEANDGLGPVYGHATFTGCLPCFVEAMIIPAANDPLVAGPTVETIWEALVDDYNDVAASFGKLFSDNLNATVSSRASQASVDTIDDILDTEFPALITAVNTIDDLLDSEMPALTTAVGAIKTQTDKFVFTVANVVDANIQRINDVALQGVGTAGDKWRPA